MEENKLTKQENDALAIFGKGKTIYQVAGNDVALSFDIVRNYLTKVTVRSLTKILYSLSVFVNSTSLTRS